MVELGSHAATERAAMVTLRLTVSRARILSRHRASGDVMLVPGPVPGAGHLWAATGLNGQLVQNPGPQRYYINLTTILIRNTRSAHQDTNYAMFNLTVNGQDKGTVKWDGSCHAPDCTNKVANCRDMNNGTHNFGCALGVDTGLINDTDTVEWTATVVNSGHPPSDDNYNKAASNISQAACNDPQNNQLACLISSVGQIFAGWAFANCDGPVGEEKVTTTGADLYNKTNNARSLYIWSQDSYGTDSPSGCGSNSNYRLDVYIERRPLTWETCHNCGMVDP
jgi:hypothetical protein